MNNRYRSKPSEVEALQYGPDFTPTLVEEVAAFIAGRDLRGQEIVEYVQPDGPWDPPEPAFSAIRIRAGVDGAQGWVSVPLGHWIVRGGDPEHFWPVDPDHFDAKYVPAVTEETAHG